ncbi:MAG: hypothetical protein CFE44_16015 [Burkholderiales bacterium PBB4]|nr:MAG: hypothetical protein CFE44_16015 [Burkholderiales bacterium PBB4]
MLAGAVVASAAMAAEPPQSLAERRLSIIKRNSSGIVLLDLPSDARPAAAASTQPSAPAAATPPASASAASASTAATPTAVAQGTATTAGATPGTAAAPQPAVLNRFFSTMPAPSGRSLQDARRLDAPDQGIALPFARTAPQPAAAPDAKSDTKR